MSLTKITVTTAFLLAVTPLATAQNTPQPAAKQVFLSPQQAAQALVGAPWSAMTGDGKQARVTFNSDGTGEFDGPFTLSTSWAVQGENICLKISIAGTKCLRFRQVAGGMESWNGNALDLTLKR